jgi:hypothetical protein
MAGEKERDVFTYVSDDTETYNVKLGGDIGLIANLGFAAIDVSKPFLPRYTKMREADFIEDGGERRRRYPVGKPDADIWTLTAKTIAVKDKGVVEAKTWNVVYLTGEKRKVPAPI